jgi:hypothetical protein
MFGILDQLQLAATAWIASSRCLEPHPTSAFKRTLLAEQNGPSLTSSLTRTKACVRLVILNQSIVSIAISAVIRRLRSSVLQLSGMHRHVYAVLMYEIAEITDCVDCELPQPNSLVKDGAAIPALLLSFARSVAVSANTNKCARQILSSAYGN